MDELFLNRMLFERFRDRQKEQAKTEIMPFKKMKKCSKSIDISKIISCSFFDPLPRVHAV